MLNALTVDFEYYRMDSGLNIKTQLDELLELLERYQTQCTFFVMGELYEHYPETVAKVAEYGHEIGYHTHSHPLIISPNILADEINKSSRFISRHGIRAFRAPAIHITEDCFGTLQKNGFSIDSSSYGSFSRLRRISGITEVPVSEISFRDSRPASEPTTLPVDFKRSLLNGRIPIGSSLFVALLGNHYARVIRWINAQAQPAVFFLHSWQLDPMIHYPSWARSLVKGELSQIVYSRNLLNTIESLLKEFRFARISALPSVRS